MLFTPGWFTSYQWHVKNYESSRFLDELISFPHSGGCRIVVLIPWRSGLVLMEKYGTWRYLAERQRGFLPLIFGMLVVIPPQVCCERVSSARATPFFDFYPTLYVRHLTARQPFMAPSLVFTSGLFL
jgi:hypothetical protein